MARGLVNRLSCGAEVQKLCSSAIEAFDSMFPDLALLLQSRKNKQVSFLFLEFGISTFG